MKFLFSILIMLHLNCVSSQCAETNYIIYHKYINKAEIEYFILHNYDSSSFYYKKAFNNFNFIFARDCLIAAQIAVKEKKVEDAKLFLVKGFENGVKLTQLNKLYFLNENMNEERVVIFDQLLNDRIFFDFLTLNYLGSRKRYLDRLDKKMIKTQGENYILDQINKNRRPNENDTNRRKIYSKIISNNIKIVDSYFLKSGFPLEKRIGLSQTNLNIELGLNSLDIFEYFNSLNSKEVSEYNLDKDQFNIDDNGFYNSVSFCQFIHYTPFYFRYKSYFYDAIKKGEIHPREVGLLHDFRYKYEMNFNLMSVSSKKDFNFPFPKYTKRIYYLLGNNSELNSSLIKEINLERSILSINTIEVDLAKRNFEVENKVKIASFGFFRTF